MPRFHQGDRARLNYRESRRAYYGKNHRYATTKRYLGDGLWEVETDKGRTRKWFTADMDNVTGLYTKDDVRELLDEATTSVLFGLS